MRRARPRCSRRPRSGPTDTTTANNSVPFEPFDDPLEHGPHRLAALRRPPRILVTGNYKGTTDEILQWVSCKWGIDINLVRADAWTESNWVQSTVGDSCGTAGDASYGILQVKNANCSGQTVHGGYPYTQDDTALDADYWGARLRACFDGAVSMTVGNGCTTARAWRRFSQPTGRTTRCGVASGPGGTPGAGTTRARRATSPRFRATRRPKPWLSLG